MATKKKMLQAAAGNAGGGAGALDITDVFSTYLYTGTGAALTITNEIDLAGEGGLVWIKNREAASGDHWFYDTERGAGYGLITHSTNAETSFNSTALTSFNSNGFSVGDFAGVNTLNDIASWTFRKAPKFFDVVTYTGTGSPRTISHDLGCEVGCIIVKAVSGAALGGVSDWTVYHRGVDATNPEQYRLYLNTTGARVDQTNPWNDTAPTSTEFTVGTDSYLNANGDTYVAYLFAHNDGDGGFGPDGDADIIKCGSYTGTGVVPGNFIELGFEPQWVMVKSAVQARPWVIVDNMRGMPVGGEGPRLLANDSAGEVTNASFLAPRATGFEVTKQNTYVNASGETYIYIAIRRGPLAPPESGTEVFDVSSAMTGSSQPAFNSSHVVDMGLQRRPAYTQSWHIASRLTGTANMYTDTTASEVTQVENVWDFMDGWGGWTVDNSDYIAWNWKRAPGFFDVVAYTGDGTAGRTVSHNLGVAPEMMIVKRRNSARDWIVYTAATGAGNIMNLNATSAAYASTSSWNNTAPSSSEFTVGALGNTNGSGDDYIAYLFASLDGVSKVGSYTGNGSSQTIDCGFTSGARFILVKRTDSTGDWYVWDTERGIVAGNDPYLELNTTDAEVTSTDWVDPDNSGFIVNGTTINASGGEYIFYSVA